MSIGKVIGLASWAFWGLGIAGYVGVDIPYLTDEDAFLFLQGNEREGGWGFNYAMVIAIGMTIDAFVVSKVLGGEDDDGGERESQSLSVSGIVVEDGPPAPATWTCECGRTNPSDNFNCASCGAEQPPLSSGQWET